MTVDTAADFLLEYLMQLINCDNRLIVKAYEAKLIEKEEIEWLYEEMQFLRKFLKDTEDIRPNKQAYVEKVKEIVAKIRDVIYEVEVIIDLCLLDAAITLEEKEIDHFPDDDLVLRDVRRFLKILKKRPRRSRSFENTDTKFVVDAFKWDGSMTSRPNPLYPAEGEILDEDIHLPDDGENLDEDINFPFSSEAYIPCRAVRSSFRRKPRNTCLFIPHISSPKVLNGLKGVIEEIKFIKTEVIQTYEKMTCGIGVPQIQESSHVYSTRATSPTVEREIVVGLEDETTAIIDLLTEGHEKQLKLIPIVGMPGLGKTTLATRLYNHSFIIYHFYVRAWTHVSQVYHKRDLLLSISNSANIQLACDKLSDEKLGEELYKHLKGNRYLIVMDDIWNISAWNDLKRYFPNDNNGSRIIFTTRLGDVATLLHAKPHYLRFLNEDESWNLLQQKTFQHDNCPPDLKEIGKRIAKKCGGLPLAIVVLSGLLAKNDKTPDWWRHVAKSVSSYIVRDPEQYMDTLAFSYDYLPNHLKPCFLYFSAFREDCEIPVWQLIWLWVAEGFIKQNESKSLEDVATDNLMDLISRSLVVVSKKRSNGGVKACRIHDLLRDLCLRKAQEENFLLQNSRFKQTSFSSSSSLVANKQRRLCADTRVVHYIGVEHLVTYVRTFLSLDRSFHDLSKEDVPSICQSFQLLRVLNLSSVDVPFFPIEIKLLVHLRYLALFSVSYRRFDSSISNLSNLETYIVGGFGGRVALPDNMWKMMKLRHLYTKHFLELPQATNLPYHSALNNLQTIGKLDLRDRNNQVLALMPYLRKLKCVSDDFPKLDFLFYLETLQVISSKKFRRKGKLPQTSWFPPNLKKLTLSFFRLPWEEMRTLARLPNIEVLKLSREAFEGSTWDANDSEFRTLRFLKLQGLDIEQWNASSKHFPNLQRLVLDRCQQLKQIPNDLGEISTLEMIQLQYCSNSAETSARKIQEEQQSLGNDGLEIFVQSWRHD
ncbi:putative late blight resistance protein homolog R1A-10 [Cornus florida]|uniref:putative late blight resistance protein homolog R1A-10 n=1 Tax=Cornus florida TaxID=4283 RepID=UPI00289E5CB5|nr:putative late blight resistance protein homolog R1A-10 [Cornus florida]